MTSSTYVVSVAFTRCKHDPHMTYSNLTKYQKGVTYTDINTFNNLPPTMKRLNRYKVLNLALSEYLLYLFISLPQFKILALDKNK